MIVSKEAFTHQDPKEEFELHWLLEEEINELIAQKKTKNYPMLSARVLYKAKLTT